MAKLLIIMFVPAIFTNAAHDPACNKENSRMVFVPVLYRSNAQENEGVTETATHSDRRCECISAEVYLGAKRKYPPVRSQGRF